MVGAEAYYAGMINSTPGVATNLFVATPGVAKERDCVTPHILPRPD
jgi:hypothetical protein